jgi:hypothetical protein
MGDPSPEKGQGNRHRLQADTTQNRRKVVVYQTFNLGSFRKLRTPVMQVLYSNFRVAVYASSRGECRRVA